MNLATVWGKCMAKGTHECKDRTKGTQERNKAAAKAWQKVHMIFDQKAAVMVAKVASE